MGEIDLVSDVRARSLVQIAVFYGVNPATTHRWATDGNRYGLRLRTIVLGGKKFTCESWAREFATATTKAAESLLPKLGPPRVLGRPARRKVGERFLRLKRSKEKSSKAAKLAEVPHG